ncbi:hypothetical protein BJX63DRAFT_426763 [Aspergillus granulosus]|uniref:Rhodopsin domain-containing protein n=1 Tax=Aspergillus granulosus TaxID=176169 RepID=A0ABR4I597_9EURO
MAQDDLFSVVIAATGVLLAIPCVVVIFRCYVRVCVVKALGWDDGVMLLALVFHIIFSVCLFRATFAGYGQKMAMLTPEQRAAIMRYLWGSQLSYAFGSSCCRLSVCIFLIRLTVKTTHIRIIQMVITVAAGTMILCMIVMLTQCIPTKYIWLRMLQDPTIPAGKCHDQLVVDLMYVYSTLMALSDITLGILPVFIVRKLQIRRQTKIAIAGILGMAGVASAAVIVRTVFAEAYLDVELFYNTVRFVIWSTVELSLGITAGSLATLGPLLRYLQCCSKNSEKVSTPAPQPRLFRHPRGIQDLSYPLSTFHGSVLRSDKLSTIVTEVETGEGSNAHGTNQSRVHLTVQGSRVESRGIEGYVGLEIYTAHGVTQTWDAGSASAHERVWLAP